MSKLKEIKKLFQDQASKTTVHGLAAFISTGSRWIRVFWGVSLFTSLALCFFLISATILYFLEFNYSTKIVFIEESETSFPAVSICSISGFLNSEGKAHFKNFLNASTYSDNFEDISKPMTELDRYSLTTHLKLYDYKVAFINSNETFQETISNPMNETVLLCLYKFRPCSDDDLSWYQHKLFGRCLKFETKSKIFNSGAFEGLRIEILLEPQIVDNDALRYGGGNILITNDSLEARTSSDENNVPTNRLTSFGLDRMYTEKLEYPYNDCIKDNQPTNVPIVQKILNTNFTYNQHTCYYYCFYNIVLKNCGCSYHNILGIKLNNTKTCDTGKESTCGEKYYSEVFGNKEKYCPPSVCPLECNRMSYSFTTTSKSFPLDGYGNKLLRDSFIGKKYPNMSLAELKERVVALNVFYPKLSYSFISEQKQYTITDLISSIGGSLGLLLGASLLSIMEIIYLCLRISKIILN